MVDSAELLGQSDDDALRAAHEAKPVDVLVLRDLADEFRTVATETGNDVVDVLDGEHDAAYAQRVRRRAFRLGSDRRRRVELRQLNSAVAVRGPHHGDVGTTSLSPTTRSTQRPSTGASPSSSMPSSAKNALAASRSSTTIRTLSIRNKGYAFTGQAA